MTKNEGLTAHGKGGWTVKRSSQDGRLITMVEGRGKSTVLSSFGLPNGHRVNTVRKDVMDRALGRTLAKKD